MGEQNVVAPRLRLSTAIAVSLLGLVMLLFAQLTALDDTPLRLLRHVLSLNAEAFSFLALASLRLAISQDGSTADKAWWGLLGLLLLVTGDVGSMFGMPSAVFTHGEPVLAAAGLALYLRLPVARRRRLLIPTVLVAIVVFAELPWMGQENGAVTGWIIRQAETFGLLLLTLVLVDVVRPQRRLTLPPLAPALRVLWHVALVAVALAIVVTHPDGVSEAVVEANGLVDHVIVWFLRNLESFLGVLGLSVVLELDAALRPDRRSRAELAAPTAQTS